MPRIPQYTSQVEPQGIFAPRAAQPSDFGGGQGLSDLGEGLQGAASILHEREVQQDVTNVRVDRARAYAEAEQKFIEARTKAEPGDPKFRESFMEWLNAQAQERRPVAQTTKGMQVFDETNATLMQHFNTRAAEFQAQSFGVKAKLDYKTLADSFGSAIVGSTSINELNTKYDNAIASVREALLDPSASFARAGPAVQRALLQDVEADFQKYRFTAMVELDPKEAIKQIKDNVHVDPVTKLQLVHRANAKILENDNKELQDKSRLYGAGALTEAARAQGVEPAIRSGSTGGQQMVVVPHPNLNANEQRAFAESAQRLGIPVTQLYGIAHRESGIAPQIAGGAYPDGSGKGSFFGLFQFSKDNQKKYGIGPGSSVEKQLEALEKYAYDAGYRPGMGFERLYGVIQAFGSINRSLDDPTFRDANGHIRDHLAYISNYAEAFSAAAGMPRTVSSVADSRALLMDAFRIAEERITKDYPDDPVKRRKMIDMAFSHISTYQSQQKQALEGLQQQAFETVMKEALDNKAQDISALTPQAQAAFARLPASSSRGILALMEHNRRLAEGQSMKSLADVNAEVFERIHLPIGDPNKITKPSELAPYFARGLTRGDYEWHSKLIEDQRTPDGQRLSDVRNRFFEGMKKRFDKSTLAIPDPRGGEDFFQFQQYILRQERAYREANKDPYLLYDSRPDNKEYIGNKVDQFQRSLQDRINYMANSMTPNPNTGSALRQDANARKPGETIADWKKRTGL